MVTKNETLKYAIIGGSYIISKMDVDDLKKLKQVILFGSVAAGTSAEESDIDVFFDVTGSKKFQTTLRSKLNKYVEDFYLTNMALSFKLRSVQNEFSIKVGELEKWPELAQSIASTGIIFYGRYTHKPPKLKAYTILSWEKPGKSKGALLNKMYGYTSNKKKYPGFIKKYSATKIGPATIMAPASTKDVFIAALEKYGVNYTRYDVWM